MRPPVRYAVWGFLLGLGAPLGSLLLRFLDHPSTDLLGALREEWRAGSFYYTYMAFGTTMAFSLFGAALGRLNQNLGDLSVIDGLTEIYNHRYLQEQLDQEIQRSDRYASPLTCLMLDIDDFKVVNDRYGHLFGDAVLTRVAHLIRDNIRKPDTVGRYGGEEFLVLMPQTGLEESQPLAQRIREAVSQYPFRVDATRTIHVTLSIGIASYPAPELGVKTKSALINAADQAMYRAKIGGKNRVFVWQT